METGEIIYEKVFASPRPPPKISFKDNWMKELASEVARQAECSQPIQPNPNPIYRTERPVVTEQTSRSSAQEIDTRFSLDCENTNLFVERLEIDEDSDKDLDADRDRTERPFVDIDRFQGVWIATCSWVVKQAGILVFVNSWRRSSNEEPFELCEKIPKVQCSECPLYWNQGIFHCTCGHLSSRRIHRWQLDLLSIPNYVIKNGRPHGNRHGKNEAQNEDFIAHDVRKRCIKKSFEGIDDRFQKDFKKSWLSTQNWSNWRSMHPDGQGCAERCHLPPIVRRIWEI